MWPSVLASLPEHSVFKAHPGSVCQRFIPFYFQVTFRCVDGPYSVHSSAKGRRGCSLSLLSVMPQGPRVHTRVERLHFSWVQIQQLTTEETADL